MSTSKLTDRTELAATPANGDLLHIVDISDTTGSADGTSKKITVQNLVAAASGGGGSQTLTVRNNIGSTITAGKAVYINGIISSTPTINLADHTSAGTMPAVGIVNADIATGTDGTITLIGEVLNLDTSGFSVADTLYIGTSGDLTATRPTGDTNLVQNIGSVLKVSASTGSILVEGAGRSNDVPNLRNGDVFVGNSSNVAEQRQLDFLDLGDTPGTFTANQLVAVNTGGTALEFVAKVRELGDLSDCNPGSPSDGDVLTYNAASSEFRSQAPSGGGGGNTVQIPYGFFDTNVRDVYLPLLNETETTSRQRYNRYTATSAGSVTKISLYVQLNLSGGTGGTFTVEKMTGSTSFVTIGTATFSSTTAYVAQVLTFSGASFSAGDVLYFKLSNGFSSAWSNLTGTIEIEL